MGKKSEPHSLTIYCVCEYMPRVCRYPQRPEVGVRSSIAGVTGSCELSNTGAGSQTWVLYRSGMNLTAELPQIMVLKVVTLSIIFNSYQLFAQMLTS